MNDYANFLSKKIRRFHDVGFDAETSHYPDALKDWQSKIVTTAAQKGRFALWADTGLGKTIMQLTWADQVARHTGKPVLVLTPLAVSTQTKKEAERFGLGAQIITEPTTSGAPIHISNYQKLHKLSPQMYGGVVLDESSILKAFMG